MRIYQALFLLLLPALVLQLACFNKNQHSSADFAALQHKADIKTEQLYLQMVEKNQESQEVSVFLKCNDFSDSFRDSLESLQVKISSVNKNILTARLPVNVLPAVSKLGFVTAIEGAKKARLK